VGKRVSRLRALTAARLRRVAAELTPHADSTTDSGPGAEETNDGLDDAKHFIEIGEWIAEAPEYQRAIHAIQLLQDGLDLIPPLTPETAFPNVVGGASCLTLATRQTRAALHLLLWGYYTEVRSLLRAAYESASLSRMLAHDPKTAERWLQRSSWVPQKHVDAWSGEGLGFDDVAVKSFGRAYGQFSIFAHPSAQAALASTEVDDDTMSFRIASKLDTHIAGTILLEIEAVAVFACFALRNASVDERALDPRWRAAVHEAAATALGTDLPHLERDWAAEQAAFVELRRRARDVSELDHELRQNPNSWDNLQRPRQ
jgi:hypothetical protein